MKIIRMSEVKEMMGFKAEGSIRKLISEGVFTKPVRIGERAKGWPDYEVEDIVKARIAGKSTKEIKTLVIKLHANRSGL